MSIAVLHCKITALGKWSYPDVPDGFFPVISFWQRVIWKHLEKKQGTRSDDVCSKLTNRVIIQPAEPVVYRPALLFGSWRWATNNKKENLPLSSQRTLIGHLIFLLEKKPWIGHFFSTWMSNMLDLDPVPSQLACNVKLLSHDSSLVFYYVPRPIVLFVTNSRPHVSY